MVQQPEAGTASDDQGAQCAVRKQTWNDAWVQFLQQSLGSQSDEQRKDAQAVYRFVSDNWTSTAQNNILLLQLQKAILSVEAEVMLSICGIFSVQLLSSFGQQDQICHFASSSIKMRWVHALV